MKAVVLHEHGQMDKLIYEENFPDPVCGPNDVIVGVKATSLNYHDLFTRNGMPGIKLKLPIICGLDVAGNRRDRHRGQGLVGWRCGPYRPSKPG
jgi:alcohol dehydrogenase